MKHYIIFGLRNQIQNIFIILVRLKILKNGIKREKMTKMLFIRILKKNLHSLIIILKNMTMMIIQFGNLMKDEIEKSTELHNEKDQNGQDFKKKLRN